MRRSSDGPYLPGATDYELSLDHGVALSDPASRLLANRVRVARDVTVHDVYYNSGVFDSAVSGDLFSPLELPLAVEFPQVAEVSPGSEHVLVERGSVRTLPPGAYGLLEVERDAVVEFEGGIYHFAAWRVGRDARLHFGASADALVAGSLEVDRGVFIGPSPDAADVSAADIVLSVAATNAEESDPTSGPALRFGGDARITATVQAPRGTLAVDSGASITGSLLGRWVSIDRDSELVHVPRAVDGPGDDEPGEGVVGSIPADGQRIDAPDGETLPVRVFFSQPMREGSVDRALTVTGNVTGLLSPQSMELADGGRTLRFNLDVAQRDTVITVTLSEVATAESGEPLHGGLRFSFTVLRGVIVGDTSPLDGEPDISPERPVVVTFSGPLSATSDPAGAITASAGGEPLDALAVMDATRTRAFLYPSETWPQGSNVHVTVDGGALQGADGSLVDAAGDGQPGGQLSFEFEVLSLEPIPGTHVFGWVFDSYHRNPDGSNRPVVGATIRVDGMPEKDAVTDETGFFFLEDMPAPEFFVHIDGTTAVDAPPGTMYPSVGKPFHSIAGQQTQLEMDGEPFDVFLPPMAIGDLQPLSPDHETLVGFGPGALADLDEFMPHVDLAEWELMTVSFAPNAAVDASGEPATEGIVVPVPPARLPAPLPPGIEPPLVISVQAPGATRFDVPAAVTFPNLERQLPGERSSLLSFNHDAGEWEYRGTATVDPDGRTVTTDPGVGITAPGWHVIWPSYRLVVHAKDDFASFDACADFVYRSLLDESRYPQAVYDALDAANASLQSMNVAPDTFIFSAPVTYDEYAMRLTIPPGVEFSPNDFLDAFARDPNGTVDRFLFNRLANFERRNEGAPAIGDIYDITMGGVGPLNADRGSIVHSDNRLNAFDPYFRVSTITIHRGLLGDIVHPVFGSREWRFERGAHGGLLFATRSVERPRSLVIEIGEPARRATWRSMLRGLQEQFDVRGLDTFAPRDASLKQPELPDCYLPPAGVEPTPTTLQIQHGVPRHLMLAWVDSNATSYREIRRPGLYEFREVLPADASYTVFSYDSSTDRYSSFSGMTATTGSITLHGVRPYIRGADTNDGGRSDIGEYIHPFLPPAPPPDPCPECEDPCPDCVFFSVGSAVMRVVP